MHKNDQGSDQIQQQELHVEFEPVKGLCTLPSIKMKTVYVKSLQRLVKPVVMQRLSQKQLVDLYLWHYAQELTQMQSSNN